jgi:hypothetical protein
MEKEVKFEFYVLNYDINAKKVINYNVFRNIKVYEWTLKAVKRYYRNAKKFTYEDLKGAIKTALMNQEWARCEYEIAVGDMFASDVNELEKWDCYKQCEPNLNIITHECIRVYREYLKHKKQKETE